MWYSESNAVSDYDENTILYFDDNEPVKYNISHNEQQHEREENNIVEDRLAKALEAIQRKLSTPQQPIQSKSSLVPVSSMSLVEKRETTCASQTDLSTGDLERMQQERAIAEEAYKDLKFQNLTLLEDLEQLGQKTVQMAEIIQTTKKDSDHQKYLYEREREMTSQLEQALHEMNTQYENLYSVSNFICVCCFYDAYSIV